MIILWIALGGAIGSVLRYGIGMAMHGLSGLFPIGTMIVNILGSILLGALFAMQEGTHKSMSNEMWVFLSIGLCGGFTTFSTFGLETYLLWKEKHIVEAALYMISSMIAAPASIALGYAVSKMLKS
ncbi:MAG: fluoride efflux transporter CrcB [Ignavibacteria bacterium]|jgi:CrcB protein|nr:fluoride efflux transporter CrcB [Ignavibacteria bacterium]